MIKRNGPFRDPLPAVRASLEKLALAAVSGGSTALRPSRRALVASLLVAGFTVVTVVTLLLLLTPGAFPGEYASARTALGLPLLAWGVEPRGWVAIGALPVGVVALGGQPTGVLAFGGIPLGVVSFGGVAVGLLALGGVPFGLIAIGGLAFGLVATVGGAAIGYYSLGGLSVGAFAYAGGGVARGYYVAQGGQSERLWGRAQNVRSEEAP
jgi:hypothetical protein